MSARPLIFDFELKPLGDTALLARLRMPPGLEAYYALDTPTRQARLLVARRLAAWLQKADPDSEFVAGYDSVLIPCPANPQARREWVEGQIAELEVARTENSENKPRLHRIPVIYGGEYGPDLDEVARLKHLTSSELIERHSRETYTAYLVGFSPGFAYLGPLPAELDLPRRANPRPRVPARSVALAAGLTGVYPTAMPGGWNLIGYTPFSMFEASCEPPVRLLPGDMVQFFPITPAQLTVYENKAADLTASLVEPKTAEGSVN